jgi:hypothetical protein
MQPAEHWPVDRKQMQPAEHWPVDKVKKPGNSEDFINLCNDMERNEMV